MKCKYFVCLFRKLSCLCVCGCVPERRIDSPLCVWPMRASKCSRCVDTRHMNEVQKQLISLPFGFVCVALACDRSWSSQPGMCCSLSGHSAVHICRCGSLIKYYIIITGRTYIYIPFLCVCVWLLTSRRWSALSCPGLFFGRSVSMDRWFPVTLDFYPASDPATISRFARLWHILIILQPGSLWINQLSLSLSLSRPLTSCSASRNNHRSSKYLATRLFVLPEFVVVDEPLKCVIFSVYVYKIILYLTTNFHHFFLSFFFTPQSADPI